MGKNIIKISTETTASNGSLLYFAIPDGASVYGYSDRNITKANFLKENLALISTNEVDISLVKTRVSTLEDVITKIRYEAQLSSFTFTQEADSCISDIYFFGSGTVSVGTSLGGDEILTSRLISGNYRGAEALARYTPTSRTIYVTLSGADVDVVIIKKLNLNT